MAYGFAGHFGLAKETNWGSAQAVTDYVEILNEDVSVTPDRFDYKNVIGTLAEPDDQVGVYRVEGSVTFAAHPVAIGHFLKGALQTKSASIVASGALYTNEFYTTAADFNADCPVQPYTLEVFRDVTSSHRYAGCVMSELQLNFLPNQDVRATARLVGRSSSIIAKTTATFPGSSSKPFTFDTVSLQIGGSANTRVEALTIGIVNQLEGIPVLGSTSIGRIRRTGHQMINVSGTLDFANITEYNDFINQTERQLIVNVTKASSFSMKIDVPRMVYTAFPTGIPGKERLTVDFTAKGFYHAGSATAIKVTLTTTKSDY